MPRQPRIADKQHETYVISRTDRDRFEELVTAVGGSRSGELRDLVRLYNNNQPLIYQLWFLLGIRGPSPTRSPEAWAQQQELGAALTEFLAARGLLTVEDSERAA